LSLGFPGALVKTGSQETIEGEHTMAKLIYAALTSLDGHILELSTKYD